MTAGFPAYKVEIEVRDDTILRLLSGQSSAERRKLLAGALVAGANVLEQEVRKNVSNTFGFRGWRKNPARDKKRGIYPDAIRTHVNRNTMTATIGPKTVSGAAHELGAHIKPRRGKVLTWIENRPQRGTNPKHNRERGGWRWFVRSVNIPQRRYLLPATWTGYQAASSAVASELRKMLGA